MLVRTSILAAVVVAIAAFPALAQAADKKEDDKPFEINWSKLGFNQSFEMEYGEGGTLGLGPYRSLVLAGRQDLFWIFGLRMGAMGFLPKDATAASLNPGWGVRGDVLMSTAGLIPGMQAFAGVGGQLYNQQANANLSFVSRESVFVGVRALFLQAESRYEFYPSTGGGLFGGIFFPL
ncbi:MAG: hypothetical protein JWM80_3006 [Cyanobacteria bacterium RYN_339]|nr:hypothetical protein [Cyanobacteria bacterium RYN_339]